MKKKKNKKINLKPLLYILVILLPFLTYFFLILQYTNLFMLNTEGYSYIWFWNILSSGKILPMQLTIPRPLLVFLYGLLASPSLAWIEFLKIFLMASFGYGIFKLTYRITGSYALSFLTEILVLLIPVTTKNIAFGTSSFVAASFLVWAIYFYLEEHYYLTSLLLFFAGLVQMEIWLITFFLLIHSKIAHKKFKFSLLIGFLSPILWIIFDFFLSKDPLYSYKVLPYYFFITGTPMLSHEEVVQSFYNSLTSSYNVYISALLLLSIIFSFLKRKYETILLSITGVITLLTVVIFSLYIGFFNSALIFIPLLLLILLIPFFIKNILSFTHSVISYIVFIFVIIVSVYKYRSSYKTLYDDTIVERNKQQTCRQMAPQVSVIDDKKVLIPYKRIGMFAYLNQKDYTTNILSEYDILARGLTLADLNYIVSIKDDFSKRANAILTPLLSNINADSNIIRLNNLVIQNLYTTKNGLGKIFKIFVLKESPQSQKIQE